MNAFVLLRVHHALLVLLFLFLLAFATAGAVSAQGSQASLPACAAHSGLPAPRGAERAVSRFGGRNGRVEPA